MTPSLSLFLASLYLIRIYFVVQESPSSYPMAFMGTKSASSSSSSTRSRWTYEVFLSFRGSDTRKNFTDHLYAALNQKGIFTFRDDEKLERGTFIAPELLRAIEESRFAVVIISQDYASSRWCLVELAKIVVHGKGEANSFACFPLHRS